MMLTPQEVQDKRFEKAVFGGYDMGGVDAFLESVSDDYASLYKENAILKNKLKLLVDKIEEYRSVDDVMRKTLVTAQQNAQDILQEARKQADEILKSSENAVLGRKAELRRTAEQEEARLAAVKQETIRFVGQLRELYRKEIELLAAIPSLPVEENPKAVRADKVTNAVQEIGSSLAARIAAEDESAEVHTPEEPQPQPPQTPQPQPQQQPLPGDARVFEVKFENGAQSDFSDIWEPEEDTVVPRPRTSFEGLEFEFGPNYAPGSKKK